MKTIDRIKNLPTGTAFEFAGAFHMKLNMKGIAVCKESCYGVQYRSGSIVEFDPETEVAVLEMQNDLGATQMAITISRPQ